MNWNQFLVQQHHQTHFVIMPLYTSQTAMVGMAHQQTPRVTNEQWIQCQTPPYSFGSALAAINALPQHPSMKQKGTLIFYSNDSLLLSCINLWKCIPIAPCARRRLRFSLFAYFYPILLRRKRLVNALRIILLRNAARQRHQPRSERALTRR